MPATRRHDYDAPSFRAAWDDTTLTIADIARRYGRSVPAIHRAAMRRNFPKRHGILAKADYDDPSVNAMWHDPKTPVREIAEYLGVHEKSVSYAAWMRGWPERRDIRAGGA